MTKSRKSALGKLVREPVTFLLPHFHNNIELHGLIRIFSRIQNIFFLCVSIGALSVSVLPKTIERGKKLSHLHTGLFKHQEICDGLKCC